MRLISLLILAAGICMLAGCSSTPTTVNSGTIRARTFNFVNRGVRPNFSENRQLVNTMIQDAITKNLAARGVTKVASGGDITVGYLLIVGNNASTAMIDTYFGYAEDAEALQKKAQEAYTSSKNPNYFEAGTLLIDIIDSGSYKLLKRGYASRPILQNVSNDVRASRIQEVVDEILSGASIAP